MSRTAAKQTSDPSSRSPLSGMERKMYFKPPRIERKAEVSTPSSTGIEFYNALVNQQKELNMKVLQFEGEMQDRNNRKMSMLQMRNEKQQQAVKQFEQEAARDQVWERFVVNLDKVTSGSVSKTLRRHVVTQFTPNLEHKYRKQVCDKFVDDLVKGTIAASVHDMKQIAGLLDLAANVTTDAKGLQQHVAMLEQLHISIVTWTKKATSASTVDELLASRHELNALLHNPLLSRLEADANTVPAVNAARLALVELTRKVEMHEQRQCDQQAQQQQHAQQEQLKGQEQARQASIATTANSSASAASKGGSSLLEAQFPYISAQRKTSSWLEDIKRPAMQSSLPPELEEQLQLAVQSVRHANLVSGDIFGSAGGDEEDGMSGGNEAPTTPANATAGVPLKHVDRLLSGLETLLHAVVKGGAQPFLRVLITLSEAVLEEVQAVTAEEDIKMYAVVVCGMFRALSANMYKQSAHILHALLLDRSCRCVPDLFSVCSGTASRVLILQAALIGQFVETLETGNAAGGKRAEVKVSSPLTAAQGWTWLQRAAVQLQLAVSLRVQLQTTTNNKAESTVVETNKQLKLSDSTVPDMCKLVRMFIRLAGNAIALKYQDKFVELLQAIQKTLQVKSSGNVLAGTDVEKLLSLVDSGIRARYVAPAYYRSQAPFMLEAASLTRYVDRERHAVAQAEVDKKGPFMLRVKELQIDRLRVIFNKLSVTPESQAAAVSSLLEKIIISNKESSDFLKYTLFKIATNIASDCQEEFFNEMDEGHPLKLARVSVGLCASIKELGDLIKAQFYKQCPLCIPKAAEVGLSGEDFLRDMGFKAKNTTSGEVKWEDKSQWLARMSKMLCTFCVLMIQPEQYPLGVGDAWAWLAQLVNLSTPRPALTTAAAGNVIAVDASGPKPPFFTATAFEVMLRVTAQHLHRAYGDVFMALLVVIQDKVLPNLSADMPRREELRKFLTSFVSSKGADFLSLFNKPISAAAR